MAILEVHHGRGRVERVTITRESPVLFGSSPKCDIVLEGPGIAPFHGRIRWKQRSRKFKADASPEVGELEVNGRRTASGSLTQGAEIRVGPCRLFLLEDDSGVVDDRTVVRPAPRSGRAARPGSEADRTVVRPPKSPNRRLESLDWLKDLEVAPPSLETEVAPPDTGTTAPPPSRKGFGDRWRDARSKRQGGASSKADVRRSWWDRWAGDQPPGQERIGRSPLVLGLLVAIASLMLMSLVLWRVITLTSARRDFDRSIETMEGGDYRNAIARFEAFLEDYPGDTKANRARVLLALSRVRQFASGAGPSWSNALKEAGSMVDTVGDLEEYRDVSTDLAEVVLDAAGGLAERARSLADAGALAEAESAVALHARIGGEAAGALLVRSRVPGKLAEARAAVLKATTRLEALAAMDAAVQAHSSDATYDARDRLVARYADLAEDRDVIARLTKANELIRDAATFDPSGRPGEIEPHPEPLGPPLSWVLHDDRRGSSGETSAPRPLVYALADGLAVGLDGYSGAPIWQVSVGLSSPFPPVEIPGGPPAVLAFDSRHDELIRLEGSTGRLVWRQPIGEPVRQPPLILGNQLIQSTPGGKLVWLDLESGALQGMLDLGRSLATSPVADEAGQFLYVLGRESNLFVVRRDPPECLAVTYLGHAAGSIACAPARLGRFLVVAENHAPNGGRWRVLLVEEDGASVRPVQQVPVEGWTWSTPAWSGSVIWSTPDRGGASAYAIGPYDASVPFTRIARVVADAKPSGPSFALARTEREAWLASSRSARLDLDIERAAIRNAWTLAEAGPALAPIQAAGRLAVWTQQWPDGGVALWGVEPESGQVRWRTVLGSSWPVAPIPSTSGQALSTLTLDGRPLDIERQKLVAGGFVSAEIPGPGSYRVAAGSVHRVELGSMTILTSDSDRDELRVRSGAETELRRVLLPAPLGTVPAAWGGGLLIAGTQGRAYLIDPLSGRSSAEPFVPPYDRSRPIAWLAPATLEGDALALADRTGVVRRFDRPAPDRPRLVPSQEVNLSEPIVAGPASTGGALIFVTADGRIRSLAARDLSPQGAWSLGAPLEGGPWSVDSHVFVSDIRGGLTVFGPAGGRSWSVDGSGATLSGPPIIREGAVIWLDRDGVLYRHSLADGTALDRQPLGILPAGGPVLMDRDVLIPTGPGSLRRLLVPSETPRPPAVSGDASPR